MPLNVKMIVSQIDDVISLCESVMPRSREDEGTAQSRRDVLPLAKQTIDRFARPQTPFHQLAERGFGLIEKSSEEAVSLNLAALRSLKTAYEKGYMQTLEELIHADLFSDFFEQAEYLLDRNFKDAAAVMAGGVLEEHLRKVCNKNTINATYVDADGKTKFKMIEAMNVELAKAKVYDKNEQKQVTAWGGIRNDAAHGNYEKYGKDQVALMIQGLRGFLGRYPA